MQALDAEDQGLDPQPAHRTSSSPPATRSDDRHPAAGRRSRRSTGSYVAGAHAAPRRRLHRDGLHAASRPRASAGARASTTTPDLANYTTIDTATRRRVPGARASHDVPVLRRRRRRDPHGAARASARPRTLLARAGMTPHLRALPAARATDAQDARRSTSSACSTTSPATSSPTPRCRRRSPRRSTASCSTPSRATASSTPARWRCCCGWPASPRASPPASPPARPTSRPASTSCATSTRTPGSRSTTRTGAG